MQGTHGDVVDGTSSLTIDDLMGDDGVIIRKTARARDFGPETDRFHFVSSSTRPHTAPRANDARASRVARCVVKNACVRVARVR